MRRASLHEILASESQGEHFHEHTWNQEEHHRTESFQDEYRRVCASQKRGSQKRGRDWLCRKLGMLAKQPCIAAAYSSYGTDE